MNAILLHFLSGQSYLTGCFMLLASIPLSFMYERKLPKIAVRLFLLLGLLFMLLSGTPCGTLYRVIVIVCVSFFVILQAGDPKTLRAFSMFMRASMLALLFYAMLAETARMRMPRMEATFDKIFVIGDSISSGIGFKGETAWPDILASKAPKGVSVRNLSVGGGTSESAIDSAFPALGKDSLAIVEIGGNDLLSGISAEEFMDNLDKLLGSLSKSNKAILMFELPAPPHKPSFIAAQRKIAAKYKAPLIPRRVLASAILGSGCAVDGLHLSNKGNQRMADSVMSCLPGVFE